MPKTFMKNLLMRALRIETEIAREQKRRLPDHFRLLQLKKLRLAIKDRLMRAGVSPGRSGGRSFSS